MFWLFKIAVAMPALLLLVTPACRKAQQLDNAILTGFDQRQCPCCGGLMLTFSTNATPYGATFYLVENNPTELGISNGTPFPVYVKVGWTKLPRCSETYIRINKLKLRKG